MKKTKNVITINNLTKIYGSQLALNKVSLSVNKGEIFGLLGPSGAGKTTMIKIFTGQLVESEGEVSVLNGNPRNNNKEFLSNIGVLTDNCGLYERLSIYNNLKLFCSIYDVPYSKIDEILDCVGLLDDKKKLVKNLSKGMKQRVRLARVFLHEPEILFLDEPTSGLDPVNASYIHSILKKLNDNGTTIFLTTHNMEEADFLCDRIGFLVDGKLSLVDTPTKIKLKYTDSTVKLLTKNMDVHYVNLDESGGEKILSLIKAKEITSIHSCEPTLGEVFLKVTGRDL
ncbi:ABC transporter ATP-binding protein [Oceanirhabdus sp. W0125-5]|uniref:ABC transporter ATP-binding protein n=1 Tax=Oceanirhabdus sp. W0125-5 TaxID=2999116 RepID=UPI0022F2DB3E|nr:ABC transporter ATP-binding protein [Oceanirhabdus sp. W0125-5]WBW96445.1 ABC transporter ATP-binding protein [Oceanirhabdus sp. W0125-5]